MIFRYTHIQSSSSNKNFTVVNDKNRAERKREEMNIRYNDRNEKKWNKYSWKWTAQSSSSSSSSLSRISIRKKTNNCVIQNRCIAATMNRFDLFLLIHAKMFGLIRSQKERKRDKKNKTRENCYDKKKRTEEKRENYVLNSFSTVRERQSKTTIWMS